MAAFIENYPILALTWPFLLLAFIVGMAFVCTAVSHASLCARVAIAGLWAKLKKSPPHQK